MLVSIPVEGSTLRVLRSLSDSQKHVLNTFIEHGDMTDFQLGYAYRLTNGDLDQTWSGLRTRRSELVDLGVLKLTGEIRNERNRRVSLWGVVDGIIVYP
jgi:hypothetical protein